MQITDIISAVISAIGSLGSGAGIASIFQSHRSNTLAETGNQIAQEGNREAGKANELAEQANQIAEHANQIGKRTLDASLDQSEYDWRVRTDEHDGIALVIMNDCAWAGRQVAVTVLSGEHRITGAVFDQIPGFGKESIDLSGALEQRLERSASVAWNRRMNMRVRVAIDVHIKWVTELGMHRSQVVHQTIDCTHLLA